MNTSHLLEAAGTPHALLVQRTIAFVREHCSALDASHDWRHIERVWTLARALAKEEVALSATSASYPIIT